MDKPPPVFTPQNSTDLMNIIAITNWGNRGTPREKRRYRYLCSKKFKYEQYQRAERERERKERRDSYRAALFGLMTTEQRRTFNVYGYFDVEANDSRVFRIYCNDYQGNVTQIYRDGRHCYRRYCAVIDLIYRGADGNIPEQHWISQMMMLKAAPTTFFKIAL